MWRMKPRIFGFMTCPSNPLKPPLGVPIRKLKGCLVGVFKFVIYTTQHVFSQHFFINNFTRTILPNGP